MKRILIALSFLLFLPIYTRAETELYTLYDEATQEILTYFCGTCDAGDEYISGNNRHYRIKSVDAAAHTATAEFLGNAEMPDVSWLETEENSLPVSAVAKRKIALYCTHSDESYIKGDGTESVEGKGGIYDIAGAFAQALEKLGASVEVSDATHLPHDAGAYRRSRTTAVELLKNTPNAIFDIHRDGIPDPDEYSVSIGGEDMSKIRLLVGKSNQNKEANLSFAKQIKAVADKLYPGLIKDIYMGKGSYNQDLAPRSVLLEFGTHTLSKELVMRSVEPISETVYKTLFGGIVGSAPSGNDASKRPDESNSPSGEKTAKNDQKGSGMAVWLIVALGIGLGVFAFLSTGGKGGMTKWKRSFSEMTGGLLGRKPPRNE